MTNYLVLTVSCIRHTENSFFNKWVLYTFFINFKQFTLNLVLHEERALILGKQGSHEKALAIYIFQLHNTDKAEHYCTNLYDEDPENNKIVRLIVVYFKSFLFNFSNYILLTYR